MLVHKLANVSPKELVARYFRKKCLKFKPNVNYFLNPNDAISELPLRGIEHDRDVVEAIKFISKFLPDIFIDVGANIGLVSMPVSSAFKKTICLEPNPLVYNILETNTMLNMANFDLYKIGLAAETKKIELHVPKVNLGGAFILENNSYSKVELVQKDGYREFDLSNYIVQVIEVLTCEEFFGKLNITTDQTVMIKIDVEGLDELVFGEILRIFEGHFRQKKIGLVFESHTVDSVRKINDLVAKLDYQVFNIRIIKRREMRNPILRRVLKLIKGEDSELIFSSCLDKHDTQFTNYACIPKNIFNYSENINGIYKETKRN